MKNRILKKFIFFIALSFIPYKSVNAQEISKQELNQINIDKIKASSGIDYILLPNGEKVYGESATYTVYENGIYTFSVFDRVGNFETIDVEITNIDLNAPNLELTKIENDEFVEIDIKSTDDESGVSHIILPDGKRVDSDNYKFKVLNPGEYTFQVYDIAGNMTEKTMTVSGIKDFEEAERLVEIAEQTRSMQDISIARESINNLPESSKKDELQDRLNVITDISDITFETKTTTANVDIYTKCENMLSLSLNTNSVTFEDFSGVEDMEKRNAVEIKINSSLPYDINAYMPTEIQNPDKNKTMDLNILNIKENSENNYQTFANTNDKIALKENNSSGNNITHSIDIKLKGGIAHEKDVYKTTIKIEVVQK